MHDLVVTGGRVIDPETGLDGPRTVIVDQGTITAVALSDAPVPDARRRIDATDRIVAPGFVDLHSHAQTVAGHRLQALDGVTTALELEAGALPIDLARRAAAEQGRPINHGWSTSWAMARMHVLAELPLTGAPMAAIAALGDERWQGAATSAEIDQIVGLLEQELAAGALGIGLLVGYAQGSAPDEYLRVAALAAQAGAPTFTHARDLVEVRPEVPVDGAQEIVRAAAETGAAMHYCHVNSTSTRHVDRVLQLLDQTRAEGSRVTVEAYPYGAGMTGLGAQFLAPEMLGMRGLEPTDLVVAATGERIEDEARLRWLRANEPHHLVIVEFVDEEAELAAGGLLSRALAHLGTVVASDALFPIDMAGGSIDTEQWPLPETMTSHPRVSGTYARSLRLLVDQIGMSWSDAIGRCTLEPARIVESVATAMRRKGRVQVGADADLVVLDPKGLRDTATYDDPLSPSVGIDHVLVHGVSVVEEGAIVVDAMPGRAVVGT